MIYDEIINSKTKQIACLIDPDKVDLPFLNKTIDFTNISNVDFIFYGGSLMIDNFEAKIKYIKSLTNIPLVIFPGSNLQISDIADGILFLSLISGRNPDFLISNQIMAAPLLAQTKLEVISTGYMLVESGKSTAVEYISNTKPLPRRKPEIATATALAAQMMGMKLNYLEAGSGAKKTVPAEMIKMVKKNTKIPLIVGGGITTTKRLNKVCSAGADLVVVGNHFERIPSDIPEFTQIVHSYTK